MNRIGLTLLVIVLVASNGISQIINVPTDQPSIQAGIDIATDGDTVLVADSTYYENINFLGKAITVASGFILDGDTSHISKTIIDGSQSANPDTSSVVIMWSGEDTTSVLMGFTITGGGGTLQDVANYLDYYGGGIVIEKSGGKILNNIIEENHVTVASDENSVLGGGIGANVYGNHTLVIRNNIIRHNSVNGDWVYGGGISVSGGRIFIEGNSITDNTMIGRGEDAGGGILWGEFGLEGVIEEVFIRNNLIDSNTGSIVDDWSGGGGIYTGLTFQTGIQIYNNVISNNSCGGFGGGIFNWDNDMIVYNNTIINNQATLGGNSMYNRSGEVAIFNNILWSGVENNQTDYSFGTDFAGMQWIDYNLLKEPFQANDPVSGAHNIFLEPSFRNDSYELSENCPAIGRGIDSIEISGEWYYAPPLDFTGSARPNPVGSNVDIGALESPLRNPVSTMNRNAPQEFLIYPNPIKDLINLRLDKSGIYEMKIVSLSGQEFYSDILIGDQWQIDLSSFQKGIYFITIRSKDFVTTRKIIKL